MTEVIIHSSSIITTTLPFRYNNRLGNTGLSFELYSKQTLEYPVGLDMYKLTPFMAHVTAYNGQQG